MSDASPSGIHSRRVLKGFLTMSGTSAAVMVVQLGYAALASRVMGPDAFGAYAVALSGIGILGMAGGSTLGQAAARRPSNSDAGDGALLTAAVLAGTIAATLAFALAPLWAQLWGIPEATSVTRVLALGMPLSAAAGVLAGVFRRFGRTHEVAARSAVGQLLGMGIGLVAVLNVREPWSLAITPVGGSIITCLLLAAGISRARLRPRWPSGQAVEDVIYGSKAAAMNLLRSSSGQVARWSISRFAGAPALGAFNRATTIVTIPLETLQRSFNYALFPELRPGGPVASNPRALTDILILTAWPAVILVPVSYFAAPPILSILLGSNWEAAAQLAGLAALMGVVPMIAVPLASALEALGHFRVTALAWFIGSCVVGAGVVGTIHTHAADPAMIGMIGAEVSLACVAGIALSRRGLLSGGRLLRAVIPLAGIQVVLTISFSFVAAAYGPTSVICLWTACVVAAAETVALLALGDRTVFGAIAKARGLPGFASRP